MGQHTLRLPAPATPHLPAVRVARTGLSVFCSRAHTCAAGDAVAMVTTVASLVVTPNHHTLKIRRARTAPLHDAPWQATKDTTIGCFTSTVQRSANKGPQHASGAWYGPQGAASRQVSVRTPRKAHTTRHCSSCGPRQKLHTRCTSCNTPKNTVSTASTRTRWGGMESRAHVCRCAHMQVLTAAPQATVAQISSENTHENLNPFKGVRAFYPPPVFAARIQDAVAWPASGWGLYGVSHTCE